MPGQVIREQQSQIKEEQKTQENPLMKNLFPSRKKPDIMNSKIPTTDWFFRSLYFVHLFVVDIDPNRKRTPKPKTVVVYNFCGVSPVAMEPPKKNNETWSSLT